MAVPRARSQTQSTTVFRLMALTLLLAACGGGGGETAGGDADDDQATEGGECTETLVAGISVPMSGAAAGWGIGLEYAAEQAAEALNAAGGVTAGGTTYCFEVTAHDNEYTAAGGARVAQTLLQRDNVDFIAGVIGTAPMQALQAQTEEIPMIHLTGGWDPSLKGPDFPYTFTIINSPLELLEPLYTFVTEEHPDAETVHLINANDDTGEAVDRHAKDVWADVGIEVTGSDFYERGTTEFAGIATGIIRGGADVLDMGATPPGEAGLLMQALVDQGWDGVRIVSAGTGGADLVEAGGESVEGTYMGMAADFSSDEATEVQQELHDGLQDARSETLSTISVVGWDGMMAFAAALDHAGSPDAEAIKDALPEVVVDSSYGPAVFGAEDVYGTPQQLLLPVIVTQIQDGQTVDLQRLTPSELDERLEELGG